MERPSSCQPMSQSNRHAAAQHDYANRHGANGRRRYVSATGSNGDRGAGCGRGQGGRSRSQRGGRGTGRGRGRTNGRATRAYINNVDITDPHRNFTSAEWEKLGTMQHAVLQMRDGNNGGRGGNNNRSTTSTTNCTTSGVSANGNNANKDNNTVSNEASVVLEMTERGSQNGRSFGRGAYSNNN